MDRFTKHVVEQSEKAARDWVVKLFAKKLEADGVSPDPRLVDALVEHSLSGRGGRFIWEGADSGKIQNLTIAMTEEDLAEFDRLIAALTKAVPNAIGRLGIKAGDDRFRHLKASWPDRRAYESTEHQGFRQRLEERWGTGFDFLRMLHTLSLEMGEEAFKRFRRSNTKRPSYQRGVLLRLHARARQVLGEIITLTENGYADGAMARWRTLHEIVVVALIISDFGEEIAERYIEHDAVEAWRALDLYTRNPAPGHRPASKRDQKAVKASYETALQRFGPEFKNQYGWAAHHLKIKPPTFDQLEIAAGRASSRSHYKMASYNVHAGVKGISFRLGHFQSWGVLAEVLSV